MAINRKNVCMWIEVLQQLLQMLFTDFSSFVIPNLSWHHLHSDFIDVDSFHIKASKWPFVLPDARSDRQLVCN
jgi:hypothetical protein